MTVPIHTEPANTGLASTGPASAGDRFTMDVLREAFAAITDEMFVSLQRTSQSPIIYEVLDFGVGVSDAHGELVSQGNGVAGFLGPLGDAVTETIRRGMALRPGDVIIATTRTPAAARTCPTWRWSGRCSGRRTSSGSP